MPDALKSCIFCDYIINKNIIIENQFAIAVYDNYPVNKGHTLIIPKRHFSSYFDATKRNSPLNNLIIEVKAHW